MECRIVKTLPVQASRLNLNVGQLRADVSKHFSGVKTTEWNAVLCERLQPFWFKQDA